MKENAQPAVTQEEILGRSLNKLRSRTWGGTLSRLVYTFERLRELFPCPTFAGRVKEKRGNVAQYF
jgi:hypothetical protein